MRYRIVVVLCLIAIGSTLQAQESNLKNLSNQADLLIIFHEKFSSSLDEYVSYRESQEYQIFLTDVNEIYSQFPDSESEAGSIKRFCEYVLDNWQKPPTAVLLVGDVNYIPTIYESVLDDSLVAMDNLFGFFNNSLKMIIGRWPVNSVEQLANIVAKTIYFETCDSKNDYHVDMLFVNDNLNGEYFGQGTDSLVINLPENISWSRIDLFYDSPYNGTKEHLFDLLQNGTVVLNTFMHMNEFVWSHDSILTVYDLETLQLFGNPFFLTAVGANQAFDNDSSNTLIEELLYLRDAGTVASIAPTGLTFSTSGMNLMSNLYSEIATMSDQQVGNMLMKSINLMAEAHTIDQFLHFTLLGDPLLKLPLRLKADVSSSEHGIPNEFRLAQNYPNPFNPITKIEFNLPVDQSVNLHVYDIKGRFVKDLISNQYFKVGTHHIVFDASSFASGFYFYKLETDLFSEIKMMLYLK